MKNRKSVGWFRALAQQQIDISSIRPFFYFHHSISIQQQSILLWRTRLRVVCENCEELTMLIEWDCVLRGEEIGRKEGQEDTRARTLIDSRTQTHTSTHRHARAHTGTHKCTSSHTRMRTQDRDKKQQRCPVERSEEGGCVLSLDHWDLQWHMRKRKWRQRSKVNWIKRKERREEGNTETSVEYRFQYTVCVSYRCRFLCVYNFIHICNMLC